MTTPTDHSARRRALRLVAAVATLVLTAVACGSDAANVARLDDGRIIAEGAPGRTPSASGATPVDFRYGTLDGGSAAFSALGDKPVVVNFFASWCPACIAEMPDFETVHQALDGRVDFLGLALQDRPESAASLVEQTGITYAVGTDDDAEIFEMFQGLGMPTTVFIDSDGVVQDVHSGQLSAEALRERIDRVLLS